MSLGNNNFRITGEKSLNKKPFKVTFIETHL